jgi:hypothetical protein
MKSRWTTPSSSLIPVAILKTVDNFSNGSISMKFKTMGGEADRCSGILFNVKPNGDWMTIRYNDTENNVGLSVPQRHPEECPVQRSDQAVHARPRRLARIEDDRGRRRFPILSGWHVGH